jgi:hypothetical protein
MNRSSSPDWGHVLLPLGVDQLLDCLIRIAAQAFFLPNLRSVEYMAAPFILSVPTPDICQNSVGDLQSSHVSGRESVPQQRFKSLLDVY